ncbi:hypothetical protein Tco_0215751 [Tanacetum coccineum]
MRHILEAQLKSQNQAAQDKPESPYDTEYEITIIKRFQPNQSNDDAQITFLDAKPYDLTKSRDADSASRLQSMPDNDLPSLSGFETANSQDEDSQSDDTLHASVDVPAKSDPLGYLQEELCTLSTKVDNLESTISKKVSEDIQSSVPSIVTTTLKDLLPSLLLEALKETLPSLIQTSVQQVVQKPVEEQLQMFKEHTLQDQLTINVSKPMNKQFHAFNTLESHRFVTFQKEPSKVIQTKMGKSVKEKVCKGMEFISDKLSSIQSYLATNSQHVSDLRQAFQDINFLLELAEVFKKANAEGEK